MSFPMATPFARPSSLFRLLASRGSLAAALLILAPAAAEERILEEFPLVVRTGLASAPAGAASEDGTRVLPDLPFTPERGYGYVGGRPERLAAGGLFGGERSWIPAWREGVEKYVFRVPRGEYLVELTFLETDAAVPGLRVFDVVAEEREVLPRLDIAARAGDFTWLTLSAAVSVFDGWLDLRFVPVTAEKPPRIARLRLLHAGAAGDAAAGPGAVRPRARGGAGCTVLRWDPPAPAGIAGYGIFRGDTPGGESRALLSAPVVLPAFTDWDVEAGKEHSYRVVALDVHGRQGPLSEAVTAAARTVESLGLRVYDLRIPEDGLRRIGTRSAGAEAQGELRFLGALQPVKARHETVPGAWQRKKSYILTFIEEPSRAFRQRPMLVLSAQAGDATLLRERLSHEAATSLGLASPPVEPVALVLNGRYKGVYLDRQPLDRRFRRAARLDTVGLLARRTRGDLLARDWLPPGEQIGEEGNLMALTELVHELNLLNEGEMARYFEERFYLDRLVDRAALAAVRGEGDRAASLRHYLKDSRNGKWELLEDGARSGDWGIRDFEPELRIPSEADARRMLLGSSLQAGTAPREGISVLETRFLAVPELRGKLLDRIESLLAGQLSPEKVADLASGIFTHVKEAGLDDPSRWPDDPEANLFLAGPGAVAANHRARAEALRRAIALERSRPPPPIAVNEILLSPSEGTPWLEVMNLSDRSIALGDFLLVGEPRPPRGEGAEASLPDRPLGPGEAAIVKLDRSESFALSPSGGFVGLWRKRGAPGLPVDLCDAVFLGHQTKGISYGRLPAPAPSGAWAFLAAPTPGAPNDGRSLEPPPYDFRQGVIEPTKGEVTIWFRSREGEGAARPDRVRLHHREEGAKDFQAIDLAWDSKEFRFSVSLGADPHRKRTAYYFIATAAGGVERAYPLPAPDLTYFLPVLPQVRLNEVLPRPGQAGSALGEFIEVHNASDQPVDVEGFFLTDTRGNSTKWRIPRGNVIPPKGFAVFYADGLNDGNHTSFKLSNSGEFLGLFGRMEEGNLPVDALVYRGMRVGESWGASPDGSKSFKAWRDPTPGARNVPKVPRDFRPEGQGEPVPGAGGAAPEPKDRPQVKEEPREPPPNPDEER